MSDWELLEQVSCLLTSFQICQIHRVLLQGGRQRTGRRGSDLRPQASGHSLERGGVQAGKETQDRMVNISALLYIRICN